MKVFEKPGSKERLIQMMGNVNKLPDNIKADIKSKADDKKDKEVNSSSGLSETFDAIEKYVEEVSEKRKLFEFDYHAAEMEHLGQEDLEAHEKEQQDKEKKDLTIDSKKSTDKKD